MYVKKEFSFLNVVLAGFLLSLVMSARTNARYRDITAQSSLPDWMSDFTSLSISRDDGSENADKQLPLDWSRVEVSIAMIRTSLAPHCWANCVGFDWRGSKVRLTFPPAFLLRVKEELGGADVGKSWFVVKPDSIVYEDKLKIYFDLGQTKRTADGRRFVERSSNQGMVTGGSRCTQLLTEKNEHAPLSFILESVQFASSDDSKIIALYPNTKAEAVSSGKGAYSCAGPYVTRPVVPW